MHPTRGQEKEKHSENQSAFTLGGGFDLIPSFSKKLQNMLGSLKLQFTCGQRHKTL